MQDVKLAFDLEQLTMHIQSLHNDQLIEPNVSKWMRAIIELYLIEILARLYNLLPRTRVVAREKEMRIFFAQKRDHFTKLSLNLLKIKPTYLVDYGSSIESISKKVNEMMIPGHEVRKALNYLINGMIFKLAQPKLYDSQKELADICKGTTLYSHLTTAGKLFIGTM